MHLFRNAELKRASIVLIAVSLLCGAGGYLLSPHTALLVLLSCAALSLLFFLWTARRYRHIAMLSSDIDRILHGDHTVDLTAETEGELSILRDELHKMVVRLTEQTSLSEREHKRLSDVIADIAHQLRTPLTAMHIDLSLLQSGDIDDAKHLALLREISMLATRFDWLVESMLKFSRIDANAAHFQLESVPVETVVRRALQPLAIPMDLRDQHLDLNIPDGVTMLCDPAWTAEAIGNVLKNCMEHSGAGGTIAVFARETPLFAEVTVEDEGTGIAPEDLPHLFERFYRGKNASVQSAGIGLALARTILAAESGTIRAENRVEGGARFIIRIYKSVV